MELGNGRRSPGPLSGTHSAGPWLPAREPSLPGVCGEALCPQSWAGSSPSLHAWPCWLSAPGGSSLTSARRHRGFWRVGMAVCALEPAAGSSAPLPWAAWQVPVSAVKKLPGQGFKAQVKKSWLCHPQLGSLIQVTHPLCASVPSSETGGQHHCPFKDCEVHAGEHSRKHLAQAGHSVCALVHSLPRGDPSTSAESWVLC